MSNQQMKSYVTIITIRTVYSIYKDQADNEQKNILSGVETENASRRFLRIIPTIYEQCIR